MPTDTTDVCLIAMRRSMTEFFSAEQTAAAGLRHAHVLDPSDLFCGSAVCQPIKNGIIVYSHESYISEPFEQSLGSTLGNRLAPLVSGNGW